MKRKNVEIEILKRERKGSLFSCMQGRKAGEKTKPEEWNTEDF
jgi:hypothetical protein